MTILNLCILGAIVVVLIGNLVYMLILVQRHFHKAETYIEHNAGCPYITDLNRIIRKVNGWLYLLIFFNCVYYSFGPWSIVFPMFCFLTSSSSKSDLTVFCSVFATIASSVLLFSNPSKKYRIANRAWREAAPALEITLVKLKENKCDQNFKSELEKLSTKISNISKRTNI